jgi:EPS-associated MarR family transcriptional regulator
LVLLQSYPNDNPSSQDSRRHPFSDHAHLQGNPDLTQRELGEKRGISVGGLNYCLNALIDKGLVKMQNFSLSKNKFGYVYLLTPKGISEKVTLTSKFLERKQAEYKALKAEIESLKAQSDISKTAQRFLAKR